MNSHITNGGQTLVFTNYDVRDNGQYICVASDGHQFAHHIFTLSDDSPNPTPGPRWSPGPCSPVDGTVVGNVFHIVSVLLLYK